MKNVALILGVNSLKIEKGLKNDLDDYSFQVYKDIDTLIKTSSQRKDADRIVISSAGLKEGNPLENLSKLREFVQQISVRTSVVLIVKQGARSELRDYFHKHFNSPLYTDMVVDKVTSNEMMLSVVEEIETLRKGYSAYKIKDIDVLEDSIDDTMSNSRENFIVERPMMSMPKFKKKTLGQKMLNKPNEYEPSEIKEMEVSLIIIKLHMNLLNNKGYEQYINILDKYDKKEFYTKYNLIKVPKKLSEDKKETKDRLDREDFLVNIKSLVDFGKEPNLQASKFVNRTGKPVCAI